MMRRLRLLPPVLQIWTGATLFLSILCIVTERIASRIPRFNVLPYNRMILDPRTDYADLWMFGTRISHFHSANFFDRQWGLPFLYPAPLAIFYAIVNAGVGRLPHHTTFFVLFVVLLYAVLGFLLEAAMRRRGVTRPAALAFVGLALLTSYPFYFELNRANMEIFVWLIAGLGIWAFLRNRLWLAATCIGIAGACKLFPFIYVGLLLLRKRYLQAVWTFVVGGATTLFSLWAVTGDVRLSASKVTEGLAEFRWYYVLHRRWLEIGLDHSIFGLIKWTMPEIPSPEAMSVLVNVYIVTAGIVATLVFFLRVRKMPVINQITFLTVACIVLPPVSYDYTLLHVYTPWTLLVLLAVDRWRAGEGTSAGVFYAFLCFIVLLSPQNEFILHGERLEGVIKCLALLALAGVSLVYPFGAGDRSALIERSIPRASSYSDAPLPDPATP